MINNNDSVGAQTVREMHKKQVVDMRLAGYSQVEIARQLNFSTGKVHNLLAEAVQEARGDNKENKELLAHIELERLEQLTLAARSRLQETVLVRGKDGRAVIDPTEPTTPDGKPNYIKEKQVNLDAVTTLLKVADRRAKLLGIDAPVEIHAKNITADWREQMKPLMQNEKARELVAQLSELAAEELERKLLIEANADAERKERAEEAEIIKEHPGAIGSEEIQTELNKRILLDVINGEHITPEGAHKKLNF